MAEFLTALYSNPSWVFIALGGVLLIIELLGTGGYSLWSGISAFIVGSLAWIVPFSWSMLWILFAIFTLLTAYVWYLWLKRNGKDKSERGVLNQPQRDLIGLKTVVVEAIINGHGRIKVNDSTWMAKSEQNFNIGEYVTVVDFDGNILKVVKTQ